MPISKYFGGSGSKVMSNMKKQYGNDKAERVFYATANKRNQNPRVQRKKVNADPNLYKG